MPFLSAQQEHLTALVVDDQPTARFLASQALSNAGLEVSTADSGTAALAQIAESAPDLVVLDNIMPDMNGLRVCELIRSNPDTAHLPILMMTGLDDDNSIVEMFEAGVSDYIRKPFNHIVMSQRALSMIRAQQSASEARRLSIYDSLTSLPNRESFLAQLGMVLANANSESMVGLIHIDVDDFKRANDTYGHQAGDEILSVLGARLQRCVRSSDKVLTHGTDGDASPCVPARTGGDEFSVLLTNVQTSEDIESVVIRILNTLHMPMVIADDEVQLSASVGIVMYPRDGNNASEFLKNAETAMYAAKRQGKHTYVFFNEELQRSASERLTLENLLRKALQRNEFQLRYQPQFDSHNGKVIGVEALCRWRTPTLGDVSPAQFIPLAESNGLIVPIGEWVLRTACEQTVAWQRQGIEIGRVSVNISVAQFGQAGFVDVVTRCLESSQLKPCYLELEITESLLAVNSDETLEKLEALHALGITLAIDDFGTGYSNLSYLKQFPVQRLKIDKSFIDDITLDTQDAAIARAIVAMSESLNLEVIAEGVETTAQLELLHELGCTEIQGYLFSRPVTADEIGGCVMGAASALDRMNLAPRKSSVLFIGDDSETLDTLAQASGLRVHSVTTAAAALDYLGAEGAALVIADIATLGDQTIEFLGQLRNSYPDTARVMLGDGETLERIVSAINKGGVFKYLGKPLQDSDLNSLLRDMELMKRSANGRC